MTDDPRARARCALCGTTWGTLDCVPLAVLGGTPGWVCSDVVACQRRRTRRKQLRLFGDGDRGGGQPTPGERYFEGGGAA